MDHTNRALCWTEKVRRFILGFGSGWSVRGSPESSREESHPTLASNLSKSLLWDTDSQGKRTTWRSDASTSNAASSFFGDDWQKSVVLSEDELFAKKLRENKKGKLALSYSGRTYPHNRKVSLLVPRPVAMGTREEFSGPSLLRRKSSFISPINKQVRPENFLKYEKLHADKVRLLEQIKEWRKTHDTLTKLPAVKRVEPLEPAQKAIVDRFWHSRSRGDMIGEVYRVQLTVSDIQTLRPRAWLNDNVIDAYLADNSTKTKKTTFAFTTHFWTRLEESGYMAVKKWAKRKKVNVLELDYLIVPVNRGNMHWCMSVVDNNAKTISFYDSLSSRGGDDVVNKLVDYLIEEADRVEPGKRDQHTKRFRSYKLLPRADCPQQDNGFDCGVFACQAALRISNDTPLDFDQADMNIIREHMALDLLKLAGVQ